MIAAQLLCAVLLGLAAERVAGHGMLLEPPNRGSMWRYGFNTPPNYEDNSNYCGTREVQHYENGGKCGECGDNWADPRPRANEHGGKYGKGVIAKTYKSGAVISTNTLLTANHMGWFEYRLCVLEDAAGVETQECFDEHVLAVEDGTKTRYEIVSTHTGDFPVTVHLPEGVTCDRCVLQWHYNTANSWGVCADGSTGVGCGPQENFRTCTDIKIEA